MRHPCKYSMMELTHTHTSPPSKKEVSRRGCCGGRVGCREHDTHAHACGRHGRWSAHVVVLGHRSECARSIPHTCSSIAGGTRARARPKQKRARVVPMRACACVRHMPCYGCPCPTFMKLTCPQSTLMQAQSGRRRVTNLRAARHTRTHSCSPPKLQGMKSS